MLPRLRSARRLNVLRRLKELCLAPIRGGPPNRATHTYKGPSIVTAGLQYKSLLLFCTRPLRGYPSSSYNPT